MLLTYAALVFSFVALVVGFENVTVKKTKSPYYLLRKYLLQGYYSDSRPVRHPSDHLNVTIRVFLYQIIDVKVASNTIKLTAAFEMTWVDAYLQWNPARFEDVEFIFLPASEVWTPELTVYYSVDSETMSIPHEYLEVKISHTGNVTFFVTFTAHSLCPYDVKLFPFDVQTCDIKFGSLAHTIDTLDVIPVFLDDFYDNQEWVLRGEECQFTRETLFLEQKPFPYGVVVLKVTIIREPFYYIFILVIPAALTTFVAVVGFHCPATSRPLRDAKFHLGLITLMSMSVLLVGVSGTLPKFSTHSIPGKRGSFSSVPLLGIYYLSLLVLIMSSTVTTSLFVALERKIWLSGEVPRWLGWVQLLDIQTLWLCLSNKLSKKAESPKFLPNRLTVRHAAKMRERILRPMTESSFSNSDTNATLNHVEADPNSATTPLLPDANLGLAEQLSKTAEVLLEMKEAVYRFISERELTRYYSTLVVTLETISFIFYLSALTLILLLFFCHGWY